MIKILFQKNKNTYCLDSYPTKCGISILFYLKILINYL